MAKDDGEGQKINKKLSAKIIMAPLIIGQRLLIEHDKKELDLFRIAGNATDSKTGESAYGTYVALMGDFEALNLISGETMRAAKVYLPNVVLEMIQGKMAGLSGDSRGVLFAFTIGIEEDKTPNSARGYVYYARSLIAPAQDDPMSKLLAALPAPKVKALAAPKADSAKK